jgi:hypothetical protein
VESVALGQQPGSSGLGIWTGHRTIVRPG